MTSEIDGVIVRNLDRHDDQRGDLVELHRDEWGIGASPVQWNAVNSAADVLRGVHVHPTHADYVVVTRGRMLLGLRDVRRASPSTARTEMHVLDAVDLRAVYIPIGVAHGFYFPEASTHFYGLTAGWSMAGELGCRWDDPDLGLAFPTQSPALSARDAGAGDFSTLVADFHAAVERPS